MMSQQILLQAKAVSKAFGQKTILNSLSFTVNQGDCLAIIGPNGTGKSVLVSCLLGEYSLSTGQVLLKGKKPSDRNLKGDVGVLLQETFIEKKLKVSELIAIERSLSKNPLPLDTIYDLLKFSDKELHQFAETLSGGKKRFLAFILMLIKQPSLIYLDEPTTGMDTSTRLYFWEIIEALKKEGKTIIYTTHYIEEVEVTADRILVLHKGKLIKDTTPYLLKKEEKDKLFTLPLAYLSLFDTSQLAHFEEKRDSFSFTSKEPKLIWDYLMENNCPISDIEMTNRSLLDHIFITEKEEKND